MTDFTTGSASNVDPRQVQQDATVYDVNDEKVGTISQVAPDYLVVSKGMFFPKERYIPLDEVVRTGSDSVHLNIAKDQLDDDRWDQPPAERAASYGAGRTDYSGGRLREGEQTVRLREEELTPRKRMEQTGEVEVRKEVHTEHRTMDVPVRREEVVVERHPVDRRPADSADFDREGETIRVPVREEQVSVEKRPVVTEEVTVGKRVTQDTQSVSADLRREEAVIDREGDVDVEGRGQRRESGAPYPDETSR